MRILITAILVAISLVAGATHNRGGEITYVHVSGNTYRFTISTCTKSSVEADRDELEISFGDGTRKDTVQRDTVIPINSDAQKNLYVIEHTYAGPGTFRVTMEDPNRNGGIVNIGGATNSDQFPFCIATEIVISPFVGVNNSVLFNDCPCPEIACVNKRYCYNPQATDPDGDSLSYALVPCLGFNCNPLTTPVVYQYPDNFGGTFSINPITGTMCWVNPTRLGEYNIAILVTEWRNGIRVGSVLRDVQITVDGNCDNDPPVIATITDTCVVAGDVVSFLVRATDINLTDVITLKGTGAPFTGISNPASFASINGVSPISSIFNWNTDCNNIRKAKYSVYFEAEDNGNPRLSDYRQVNITVKAPAPNGVTASTLNGSVDVMWNSSDCRNAIGYKIYRKKGFSIGTLDCCSQTSPIDLGYTLVGQTNSLLDTSFIDNSSLAVGEEYCYAVTAVFPIDYESCISIESCVKLKKDVPVIAIVTVNTTSVLAGVDSIVWAKATDLDTVTNYPPPYLYKIYHKSGFTGASALIYTSPAYSQLHLSDTTYVHTGVNTNDNPNNYKVEMYHIVGSDTLLIGGTNFASSIFVFSTPSDNVITLSWSENTPWTNIGYEVYRSGTIGGTYTLIGTSLTQTYIDSNLTNGVTYCYKIKSVGSYSDPSIFGPLENFSQEVCDSPVDLTPPCPPVLEVDNDCEDEMNYLSWTNPNNFCADDVTRYRIFYAPTAAGSFIEIDTKNDPTDTLFNHNNLGSIAGCYYVTALDSIQYNNESDPSNIICVDNCPIYFLPNVFSPNGDGKNDKFIPLLPYKFIDSIDFIVYNRWGSVVFQTNDPMINWDGKDQESGKQLSDGVYFYVCRVYGVRLSGLDETKLKGAISIFGASSTSKN